MVSGLGRQLLDALLDPAEGFLLPQDLAQFYGAAGGGGLAGDRHPDGPHDSPVFQPLFLGQVDEGVVHGIVRPVGHPFEHRHHQLVQLLVNTV